MRQPFTGKCGQVRRGRTVVQALPVVERDEPRIGILDKKYVQYGVCVLARPVLPSLLPRRQAFDVEVLSQQGLGVVRTASQQTVDLDSVLLRAA